MATFIRFVRVETSRLPSTEITVNIERIELVTPTVHPKTNEPTGGATLWFIGEQHEDVVESYEQVAASLVGPRSL